MATIKPTPAFNATNDANDLRVAMASPEANYDTIVHILTKRSLKERLQLRHEYSQQYKADLTTDLKSKFGGKEKLLGPLLNPIPHLLATELKKALDTDRSDDSELKGIICTLNAEEVIEINDAYEKLFGISLESAIAGRVSAGDCTPFLIALLTARRKSEADRQAAVDVAKELCDAGVNGGLGSDTCALIRILSSNCVKQLQLILEEYETASGKSFIQAVDEEVTGNLKQGVKTFVKSVINLPKVFAEQMRTAMKGAGTDDSILIRIIVWRSEIDLDQIKSEYTEHFGEGLATSIQEETSGEYASALISIIEGNSFTRD